MTFLIDIKSAVFQAKIMTFLIDIKSAVFQAKIMTRTRLQTINTWRSKCGTGMGRSLDYNWKKGGCRDCMVVGFTTTYAISAYHH